MLDRLFGTGEGSFQNQDDALRQAQQESLTRSLGNWGPGRLEVVQRPGWRFVVPLPGNNSVTLDFKKKPVTGNSIELLTTWLKLMREAGVIDHSPLLGMVNSRFGMVTSQLKQALQTLKERGDVAEYMDKRKKVYRWVHDETHTEEGSHG